MHLDWLKSFTEAAKQKSLSKAADKLNLSQPAISKHIHHLETELGVELFRRNSTGVVLTEAGNLLLQRIIPIVEELSSIRTDLRPYAVKPGFSIGSLPSVAARILPARLKRFHATGDPIAVSVRSSSAELLEALDEGVFDAVFVDGGYLKKTLWSRPVLTEPYYAIFPASHRFRDRPSIKLADLRNESFILPSIQCDSRKRVVDMLSRLGEKPVIMAEVDSNEYILGVVATGTGTTVVPRLVAEQADRYRIVAVPIEDGGLQRTICLAARSASLGQRLHKLLTS